VAVTSAQLAYMLEEIAGLSLDRRNPVPSWRPQATE
jgi:hypothetical protein